MFEKIKSNKCIGECKERVIRFIGLRPQEYEAFRRLEYFPWELDYFLMEMHAAHAQEGLRIVVLMTGLDLSILTILIKMKCSNEQKEKIELKIKDYINDKMPLKVLFWS